MSRLPDAFSRRKDLRRQSELERKTPMKRRNKQRRKKLHREHYGTKAAYVRSHPCCVCARPAPSEPHHIPSRGAGGTSKDLVPLCGTSVAEGREGCHAEFHRLGAETFQARHKVDLVAKAALFEAWYRDPVQPLGF